MEDIPATDRATSKDFLFTLPSVAFEEYYDQIQGDLQTLSVVLCDLWRNHPYAANGQN